MRKAKGTTASLCCSAGKTKAKRLHSGNSNNDRCQGFLYSEGEYTSITYPGASAARVEALGISNNGVIVGGYTDPNASGNFRGFTDSLGFAAHRVKTRLQAKR
jgi:hypothetical protein